VATAGRWCGHSRLPLPAKGNNACFGYRPAPRSWNATPAAWFFLAMAGHPCPRSVHAPAKSSGGGEDPTDEADAFLDKKQRGYMMLQL